MTDKQIQLESINEQLKPLKQKLFGNDMFKVFSKEEENSQDFKEYNNLVKEKQRLIREIAEENMRYSHHYVQEFDYFTSQSERFSGFD